MSKKYTYHRSHSYMVEGMKVNFITQLYQVGIYGIVNGDPDMQGGFTPQALVRLEKQLKKDEKDGVLSDLKFGKPITIQENEKGFWEEVDEGT